ncbi:MAG TPA: metal-dependent hydrolase [Bacillota bacterium]
MAQLGLHGLIGLYGPKVAGTPAAAATVAAPTGSTAPAQTVTGADPLRPRKDFAFGFLLGNILPDTDFFLLVLAYLFTPAAVTLHRSFSHSLVTIALLTLILWLARGQAGRPLAWGVGLGMVTHAVVDMVVWFSSVNFLWPLGYLGVPSVVNLWGGFETPPVLSNLLGAADYLAFALYFLAIRSAAKRSGAVAALLPRLNLFINLNWVLMVIFGALSFFLSGSLFNIAHYAIFTLVLLPIVLWVTFKFRPAIEAFSVGTPGPDASSKGAVARAA